MTRDDQDRAVFSLGFVTGFLSSEEHRAYLVERFKARDLNVAYVELLRKYLDEMISQVPTE